MIDFWQDKEPCGVMHDCSSFVYVRCNAYLQREKPCWEHASTRCEEVLGVPRSYPDCKVFHRYHAASKS